MGKIAGGKELIPAHAGSTCVAWPAPSHHGAHPRSRGEHHLGTRNLYVPTGSSPLTRGALVPFPAFDAARVAHPRSRGEHCPWSCGTGGLLGSSPLTRGARLDCFGDWVGAGLIPAHAGSTHGFASIRRRFPAHPRSRGEHPDGEGRPRSWLGSSPLTRGAPGTVLQLLNLLGLIPAHAGSTTLSITRSSGGGGSSPLTRGARRRAGVWRWWFGLIPAHAGSTTVGRNSAH